jgi:hypothetical protein
MFQQVWPNPAYRHELESLQRHHRNIKRDLVVLLVVLVVVVVVVVTKGLKKNLEAILGKHSVDSLQKSAVLGTSYIIREVLQCEAWTLSGGDLRWFKRSTMKKRPVTRDNNNHILLLLLLLLLIILIYYYYYLWNHNRLQTVVLRTSSGVFRRYTLKVCKLNDIIVI